MIDMNKINETKYEMSGTTNWGLFQRYVKSGDCEPLSHKAVQILRKKGVNAEVVAGFVKYPFRVFSSNKNDDNIENMVRHWWVSIDGKFFDFGVGTLVNGVTNEYGHDLTDGFNYDSIAPVDGIEYIP